MRSSTFYNAYVKHRRAEQYRQEPPMKCVAVQVISTFMTNFTYNNGKIDENIPVIVQLISKKPNKKGDRMKI